MSVTEHRRRADDVPRQQYLDRIIAAATELAFGTYTDRLGMLEAQAQLLEARVDFKRKAREDWDALSEEDRAAWRRISGRAS
jgi:hypothetical protein